MPPELPVLVVMGTRPEAIKLAGLVAELGPRGRVIHTGQHYDERMWSNVVADLGGFEVADHIAIGGRSRGEQIGDGTSAITRYLQANPARAVIVQGDTNSTLAGALATSALGVPLVHVEAGLRSHDRAMPEEINRILTDAVTDLCCAPLEANAAQLRAEGVGADRIHVAGNTLADGLTLLSTSDAEQRDALARHDVRDEQFVLATVHRAGTVDDPDKLTRLVGGLAALAGQAPVLLALHPRTRGKLDEFGLTDALGGVRVVPPLPPREFMALEQRAGLLVSDSGGVQEEACLFRRPLVVLRDSTERPELLDGWCRLLGDADPAAALVEAWADAAGWRAALATRPLPYAEGSASRAIVAELDARWPARG